MRSPGPGNVLPSSSSPPSPASIGGHLPHIGAQSIYLPGSGSFSSSTSSPSASPASKNALTANNSTEQPPQPPRVLLLFITGNPGCIEYYTSFLTHLASKLPGDGAPSSSASGKAPVDIYGVSLANFVDDDDGEDDDEGDAGEGEGEGGASDCDAEEAKEHGAEQQQEQQPLLQGEVRGRRRRTGAAGATAALENVLGLQEQIEYVERKLRRRVFESRRQIGSVDETARAAQGKDWSEDGGNDGSDEDVAVGEGRTRSGRHSPTKVILVGHSVGGYMGMELMRRSRERSRVASKDAVKGSPSTNAGKDWMEVIGYIGLFPTITWIAESSSGRRVGWLFHVPFLANAAGYAARALATFLGQGLLTKFVRTVTGLPQDAASVTAKFLGSRRGVAQALHMGRDEMLQITDDRWDEDIWGALDSPRAAKAVRPKLVLYFGADDHWVATTKRDVLISIRGSRKEESWKPKMLIDVKGIPHSFCIRHSSTVADLTAEWVADIVAAAEL